MARPREDEQKELQVRPCVGGLQTKYPSPIVIPSQSPDLLNVLFDRRSVRRREGCVPITRSAAPRNSLRNQGRTYVGRMTGTATNNTYKVVPGYGFIGHRPHFNDYVSGGNTALTVSFLVTPEPDGDNPDQAANWFTFNERTGPAASNTYTYRPLCSKGPLRGTAWNSGEGLGWAIFIYRAGANDYRWGCYIATNAGASPVLLTSAANDVNNPKPLHTYRISFTATQSGGAGNAILSVAELQSDSTALLLQYVAVLAANLLTNSCPIQVFDMPRPLIEAAVLNGGLASTTGYWRDVLRGEGRIQDLSVWSVDKTLNGTDTSWVGSMEPLDTRQEQPGLLGHWAPETLGYYHKSSNWKDDKVLIPESRGIDAPMFLGPSCPAWQRSNGKAGLYFDGRTSYAYMPTALNSAFPGGAGGNNAESIQQGGTNPANSFESMVLGPPAGSDSSHTISITFIPDSIEKRTDDGSGAEQAAQALIRWPGVVEFGITSRGRLYVSPYSGAAFLAIQFVAYTFIPGNRYTVMYARNSDTDADLFVNGAFVANIGGLAAPAVYPGGLGAMIIGVGETAAASTTTREFVGITEPETHFVGRVEDIRFGNVRVFSTGAGDPVQALNRDLTAKDLYLNSQQLASLDNGTTSVTVRRSYNLSAVGGAPFMLHSQLLSQSLAKVPFFSSKLGRILNVATVTDTTYVLFAAPPPPAIGGIDLIDSAQTKASMYAAWWNFETSCLETKLESRYRTSREAGSTTTYLYQQDLACPDKLGFWLPLSLRSREMDVQSPLTVLFNWAEVAPQELVPRIAMGLVPDIIGRTPVTGLLQLKHSSGARHTIAAAASTVYWLKEPWGKGISPYTKANDPGQKSFFGSGRIRNHVEIRANTAWDLSPADLTVEFWMMVPELGTKREISINWSGNVGAYNWRLILDESGALYAEGVAGAFWRSGTATAVGGNRPIVPGVWHHIAFTIDVSTIANDRVWIDGMAQTMAAPVGAHAAAWTGGAGKKFIAGHPLELGSPDIVNDTFAEPFLGYLRDFRVSIGLRYTATFQPPSAPFASDGTTVTLLPFNEGFDCVANAQGSTVAHGLIRCSEWLPILDGSLLSNNSSPFNPYSGRTYIDTLYMTNGLGAPLAVRWRGLHGSRYADPLARGTPKPFGFSVARMGATTPGYDPPSFLAEGTPATAPVPWLAAATPYNWAVTFVTEDGIESDPILYSMSTPAAGTTYDTLRLNALPRSLEPHVVARYVYYGITTPTQLLRTEATNDNLTDQVELRATEDGLVGGGKAVTADRGAPPQAHFIEIRKGRSYLFDRNSVLYVSSPVLAPLLSLENFPALNQIKVNETTGVPGAFLQEHLGGLYVGDRDSIYAIGEGQTFESFRKDRLLAGKGFASGHSVVAFDNHMFGAMEKGVHVFDGSGIDYIGEDLEGLWNSVDLSEDAGLSQHGVYHEPTNQYWLSIRRDGEEFGREIVVFDKVVTDPGTGRNPWSLMKTMAHSFMARIEDEQDDTPYIYLGTPDGRVFQMLTGQIDGSRVVNNPAVAGSTPFTLSGTATSGSVLNCAQIGATFDGMNVGLRGILLTVTHSATHSVTAARGVVEEVRIKGVNGANILLYDTLTHGVEAGDTYAIGAYWAYYSTPWLSLGSMTSTKVTRWFDLDFLPQSGALEVRALVAILGVSPSTTGVPLADAFNYGGVLTQNRKQISDMTYGFHPETIRFEATRGLYWRGFFGTRGIQKPFEVFGWNAGFEDDGLRKGLTS